MTKTKSSKTKSYRQPTAMAVAIATATATKPKTPVVTAQEIAEDMPTAENETSYRISRLGRSMLSAALDDIAKNTGRNLTGEFKMKVAQTADLVTSVDGDLIEACDMILDSLGAANGAPKIFSLLNSVQKQVLFRTGVLERMANRPTLGDDSATMFDRRNEVRSLPAGVHPEPVPTPDEVYDAAEEINVYLNALYDTYCPSIDLQRQDGAGIPYLFDVSIDEVGTTKFRPVNNLHEALEIQQAKFELKKKERNLKLDAEIAKRKAARLEKLRQAAA